MGRIGGLKIGLGLAVLVYFGLSTQRISPWFLNFLQSPCTILWFSKKGRNFSDNRCFLSFQCYSHVLTYACCFLFFCHSKHSTSLYTNHIGSLLRFVLSVSYPSKLKLRQLLRNCSLVFIFSRIFGPIRTNLASFDEKEKLRHKQNDRSAKILDL